MSRESPIFSLVSQYLPGAKLSGSGRNINARCPFHDDRSPSFSMHAETGVWICGSSNCGKSGGLAQFLRMVGVSEHTVRLHTDEIAPKLEQYKKSKAWEFQNRFMLGNPYKAEHILPEGILGLFYWKPLALVQAGFVPALLHEHEIGFDNSNRRITFPIRDLYGNLTAISGRAVDGWNNPKYLVYSRGYEKREGGERVWVPGPFGEDFDMTFRSYVADNRRCLWNAHKVEARRLNGAPMPELIIAEGFKVALWLIQHIHPNVVATMGTRITWTQYDLIRRISGSRTLLCFDNDPAGLAATKTVGRKLIDRGIDTNVLILPHGVQQADRMAPDDLQRAYQAQKEWTRWVLERQPA